MHTAYARYMLTTGQIGPNLLAKGCYNEPYSN